MQKELIPLVAVVSLAVGLQAAGCGQAEERGLPEEPEQRAVAGSGNQNPDIQGAEAANPLAAGIAIERPPHAAAEVAHREATVLAEWPVGTFVENLVALADGSFLVSVVTAKRIDRVSADGSRAVFAQFEHEPTGLSRVGDEVIVNLGAPGQPGWALWGLSLADGERRSIAEIPEALFLNGSTPFGDRSVLVTDSILGQVFQVDLLDGSYRVWWRDERLGKISEDRWMPGANGIAATENEVFVASTERALLLRVEIQPNGSAGAAGVLGEQLVGDDLVLAADGTIYLTTNVYNQVLAVSEDGSRRELAGVDQFMNGATAAALAPDGHLVVTTTGGILAPVDGVVQPAKLVRLKIS
ncbi:MAG: hypothetical protein AAGD01_18535 [Acidobacteriota bacterium]